MLLVYGHHIFQRGTLFVHALKGLVADYDDSRLKSILLAAQITISGSDMSVRTWKFANICTQIKQI